MKGQTSVEVVFVLALIVILSIVTISKFTKVQDSVTATASIRQELIGELSRIDTKYTLKKIEIEDSSSTRNLKVIMDTLPKSSPDDLTALCNAIKRAESLKLIQTITFEEETTGTTVNCT